MPEIGRIISHYKIIEKLGAGGMGLSSARRTPILAARFQPRFRPDIIAGDAE